MKTYLVLTLFVTLVIYFVTDPTPTVAEDTTDSYITTTIMSMTRMNRRR
jgi:hypothetical protein